MLARSTDDQLGFQLNATLAPDSNVAVFELTAVNLTANSIFLRVVFPKIRGIKTPGDPVNMMGAIPKEGGSVVPLSDENPWGLPPYPLGMDFIIDVGLLNARNNMEMACIFDQKRGGGVFFCDLDGDLDNGIAPLQFNLSAIEVVGFWIGDIPANSSPFFLAWELEFTRKATGTRRWITTRWFTVHAGAFRTLPPGLAKPEPSIHPPVAVPVASILLCRPY